MISRRLSTLLMISVLVGGVWSSNYLVAFGQTPQSVSIASGVIPEAPEFATQILRDPWDITEYTDISRDLNGMSTKYYIRDLQHADGIFSATTVTGHGSDAYIPLLYTGNSPETLLSLKDGGLNPIPNNYRCLYFAMKVDSGPARANNPEVVRAIWFADATLSAGVSGFAAATVHAEPGAWDSGKQSSNNWQLYRLKLDDSPLTGGGTNWDAVTSWQGLQINPVNRDDTRYSIDWARLTTCSPKIKRITWTPDSSVQAIWVRPSGTTRAIRVAPTTDVYPMTALNGSSGAYDLNTEGLMPGTYQVGVSSLTTPPVVWSADPLKINAAPIATFSIPSPTSGEDYATTNGNPWDFSDAADTPLIQSQAVPGAVSYKYLSTGQLEVTSPSGPLPAGIDTQVHLNMSFGNSSNVPINAQEYRYLNFRIDNEWTSRNFGATPWANGGMLVRWNWSVPSLSGVPGMLCTYGGNDITMDIGWRTYSIDLHNGLNGLPDGAPLDGPTHCPTNAVDIPWKTHPEVMKVRFDPNENVSQIDDPNTGGGTFVQTLDWVRLTKDNEVSRGKSFQVILGINKSTDTITQRTFYYTTDTSSPHQHMAETTTRNSVTGSHKVYIPAVIHANSSLDYVENPISYTWNTTNVAAGTYYICADLSDSINSSTYCSSVPVIVK